MKKVLSLLMMAMLAFGAWAEAWVETAITQLATGDVVVIVDKTSSRAMYNDNGTSAAPTAVAVTLNNAKDEITSTVNATLRWEITVDAVAHTYQFGVEGTANFLYGTNSNNGLRVGSSNPNNMVRAAMEGLKALKQPEIVAELRGKTVAEILG